MYLDTYLNNDSFLRWVISMGIIDVSNLLFIVFDIDIDGVVIFYYILHYRNIIYLAIYYLSSNTINNISYLIYLIYKYESFINEPFYYESFKSLSSNVYYYDYIWTIINNEYICR